VSNLKTSVLYLPRPSSKYPGCYPLWFERRIPKILGTENFIHLFSGNSTLGFKIDIKEEVSPDLVADVHKLPFADNSFDGGMADPPYTKEFAKTLYGTVYPRWYEWSKELSRVVKPNGKIAVMQNYIVPTIHNCSYEEIIVILTRIKQYPRIVTVFKKKEETKCPQ